MLKNSSTFNLKSWRNHKPYSTKGCPSSPFPASWMRLGSSRWNLTNLNKISPPNLDQVNLLLTQQLSYDWVVMNFLRNDVHCDWIQAKWKYCWQNELSYSCYATRHSTILLSLTQTKTNQTELKWVFKRRYPSHNKA